MLDRFINIVQELSKKLVIDQPLNEFLELLCHTISVKLDINRVSIWKYDKSKESILCICLYDINKKNITSGIELYRTNYPIYFDEMLSEKIINASDARNDNRTSEFTENYLKPLGIFSMLDIPIFNNGTLLGIICMENNSIREWKYEEQMLTRSIADIASVAFIQDELKSAIQIINEQKKTIENHNEHLKKKVKERTAELEKQNELLTEYAFINAHLLRGPICTMKGLVNLLQMPEIKDKEIIIEKLKLPLNKLSDFSDKITSSLNTGTLNSREQLRDEK